MSNRGLCLLLSLAIATACRQSGAPATVSAPPDSAAGEVPFELSGPGGVALMVPVHVNGQGPFRFVLDTGATLTCLDQQLADRLDLPEATGAVGMGAGVGGSGQMQLLQADSLRVGQASATELMLCAIDLGHTDALGLDIDGLLGLNFLREFRVTLDFERSTLHLTAATPPP